MTDFLKDPIYLEYMDTECAKVLSKALEALRRGDTTAALKSVQEARTYFSPSAYFQKMLRSFAESSWRPQIIRRVAKRMRRAAVGRRVVAFHVTHRQGKSTIASSRFTTFCKT